MLDSKSLLHIPPPDPVLGVGLLCNLISLQEAYHMPLRSNLAFKSEFPTCSICNEPVELETTKSNEIGEPIHEECYALEISLGEATRPLPETREEDPRWIDDPLTGTIIESLAPQAGLRLPIIALNVDQTWNIEIARFPMKGRLGKSPCRSASSAIPLQRSRQDDA